MTGPLPRVKVWLVTTLAGLLGGGAGFAVFFYLRTHIHADGYVRVVPYVALALVSISVFLFVVRTLRCPHCGRRFGWRNFRSMSPGWAKDWDDEMPERRCPNCGRDVYKSPALPGTIGANRDTR